MALLDLLPASLVGVLFCKSLVFFVLLLLKFLPVFLLLRIHLLLLLLVFLILLRVARVWRRWTLQRRKVIGMNGASRVVIWWRIVSPIARSCVSRAAVNRAPLAGGHDPATAKCGWCGCGSNRRLAAIYRRAQLWIGAGFLDMLPLRSGGRQSASMRGRLFLRTRTSVNATVSTVVANASDVALIDYCRVVNVVNDRNIHVVDGAIVEEAIALPSAAFVATAEVSVAVIDTAIKSDHLIRPITFIKNKTTATPSPISRSPQIARLGRQNPCPWNPIVVALIVIPRPKTRRPNVALAGTNRLFVDR